MKILNLAFIALVIYLAGPNLALACASCGCTLSSEWQSSSDQKFSVDLRYEQINQTQLRSGASTITGKAASAITYGSSNQEVESYTKNQYYTLGLGAWLTTDWSMTLLIPYVQRNHSTLGTASDGATAGPGGGQYDSQTSSLGDMKLLARYFGVSETREWSIIMGLKAATGSHTMTGTSTDSTAPGPVSIDPGLQPGTGTTDLVAGLGYSKTLNKSWDTFAEFLYQYALAEFQSYRPGNGANLNFGLRYFDFETFVPQLQVNSRIVDTDSGSAADRVSTGGTLVYLSPGVTIPLGTMMQIYAFAQVPLYQYLSGVQLAPTSTSSLGFRMSF